MKKFIFRYLTLLFDRFFTRSLVIIKGDSLPNKMPICSIVIAIEEDEVWCVGLKCPCGCGYIVELPIINEANPRWDFQINPKNKISLYPSVSLNKGCKSHFWVKEGKIIWCP